MGPSGALAGDGTFSPAPGSPFGAGDQPNFVAIGDFNNDGIEDAAISNGGNTGPPRGVTVRLGAGNGTFPTQPPGSPYGGTGTFSDQGSHALTVVDFEEDGDEDLFTVVPDNDGGVADFMRDRLGNGDGTFPDAGITFGVGDDPRDIAFGDFTNDGFADAAVANAGTPDTVTVHFGAFTPSPVAVGDFPRSVEIGDFNNDGNADFAVANEGSHNVSIALGDGAGGFPSVTAVAAGTNPRSLTMGDFNNDGNQDLAAANVVGNRVTVLLGAGNGTFPSGSFFPTGNFPGSITVGDFNSDGNDDLAVASAAGVEIRLGAGNGTFPVHAPGSPIAGGGLAQGLAIGDFNSDGNEDIAFAGGGLGILLGSGPPPLAGNLLQNGGFEGAGAARIDTQSPPIPSWERSGNMTFARYGIASAGWYPDHRASPRFQTGGLNFLFGGSGASSSAAQTVDVSGSAASIDAGLASANLSAYLGGSRIFQDHMKATAAFLDASDAALGSFEIGPVTVTDRKNLTTLLRRAAGSAVPTGTRQIRVTLTATNFDAGASTAFADNVKLTLDAPDPPEQPPSDPPPGGGDTVSPDLSLSGKKTQKLGAFVRVGASPNEDSTVDATGTLVVKNPGKNRKASRRFQLRAASADLAAGIRKTLKLKVPRKARRAATEALKDRGKAKAKLAVSATDAAGNAATKKRMVKLRKAA